VVFDGERTNLPGNINPGQSTGEIQAVVNTPPTPGTYILRWSPVKETIAWFESQGVPTLDRTVNVVAAYCPYAVGAGSSRQQLFVDAYNRNGGSSKLGCATDTAHFWNPGTGDVVVQNFTGVGGYGAAVIMHDQSEDNHWGYGSIPAFVSHGEIWRTYWSTNARTFLGSITTDEYVNAQGLPQSSFRFGYITFNGSSWQAYTWPSSGTGWRAEYRNGKAVDGPAAYVRYNDTPVHDWGTTAPDGGKLGVWADNFSVKWLGRFYLVSGRYRFSTYSDDGVKLVVDGRAVLDHWVSGGGQSYTVEVDLAEGWHNLELRYFEDCGPAYINLGVVPVSFQGTYHSLESLNYPGEYIRHRDSLGEKTTVVSELDKKDATFKVVAGLADGNCISLEARNYPGYFLRHQDYRVKLHRNDGSQLFRQDATFCVKAGLADPNAVSLESKNYPGRYLRHRDGHLWVEAGDGSDLYRKDATWRIDSPLWTGETYLSFQSFNYPDRYIRHRNALGEATPIVSDLDKKDATFRVIPGLADPNCVSLESRNYPGYFLRHQDSRVKLAPQDGTQLFRDDATFCVKLGLADPYAVSFESKNFPGRYLRHRGGQLWVEAGDGSDLYRKDATWRMVAPFWS